MGVAKGCDIYGPPMTYPQAAPSLMVLMMGDGLRHQEQQSTVSGTKEYPRARYPARTRRLVKYSVVVMFSADAGQQVLTRAVRHDARCASPQGRYNTPARTDNIASARIITSRRRWSEDMSTMVALLTRSPLADDMFNALVQPDGEMSTEITGSLSPVQNDYIPASYGG